MRTSSIGALLLLGLMLAILLVALRNRKADKELVNYLQAMGFVTSQSPIAQAFTYTDMIRLDCYRGELRYGVKAYVLLAKRRGTSVMVNGVPMATFEDYIGLYLAPPASFTLDDAWRQLWQADLNARGATPLRVVQTPEGGVLLNWRSTHDKSTLEARLADVRKVLVISSTQALSADSDPLRLVMAGGRTIAHDGRAGAIEQQVAVPEHRLRDNLWSAESQLMATHALSPVDAYLVAVLPANIGLPPILREVLLVLQSGSPDDKRDAALASIRSLLGDAEFYSTQAQERLADKVAQLGINAPVQPHDGDRNQAWANAVLAVARQASCAHAPSMAAFEAGLAAGALYLAIQTGLKLILVGAQLPESDDVRQFLLDAAGALGAATQRLVAALRQPAIPPTVARTADKLASLFLHVPDLAIALTAESREAYYHWTTQVWQEAGELPAALRFPTAPPLTCPPTSEERALLAEILADPKENAPRLRFAELAAKRNDPRADMIQAQFAIVELRQKGALKGHEVKHSQRAKALATFHPEWGEAVVGLGAKSIRFYRGFIGFVEIDAGDFLCNAEALFQAAPIEHLQLRKAAGRVGELAATPFLGRIRSLLLIEDGIGDADILALAASPHSRGLQFLNLRGNELTNTAVEAIVASPNLAALVELNVRNNHCNVPAETFWFSDTDSEWGPTDYGNILEAKYGRKVYFRAATEALPLDLDDMMSV